MRIDRRTIQRVRVEPPLTFWIAPGTRDPFAHPPDPRHSTLEGLVVEYRAALAGYAAAHTRGGYDIRPDCPECQSLNLAIIACLGVQRELVTRYECMTCHHRWERRTPRTDTCEHGKALFIPCAACGRGWELIEAAQRIARRN